MTAKIVQKSVMHVQNCCFVGLSKPIAFLPFSFPSPSSMLNDPRPDHWRRSSILIFRRASPSLSHENFTWVLSENRKLFLWIELCTRKEGSKIMPSVLCHVSPLDQNGGCEYAVGALMWIVVISLFCPYSLIWKLKKTATALLLLCRQNRP